jgi:MarR family transcriptional regulator, organic hydroperoxide resistance regulator
MTEEQMKREEHLNDLELLNLLTDAVRMHSAYVENNLKRMGLQMGQGAVISTLGKYGDLPQNQIAKLRKVSPATISVMIRRMENNGLIERKNDEKDAKVHIISLTEKGKEAYNELSADFDRNPDIVFEGLSIEDKKHAEVILKRICDNLEAKNSK